ncbi:MAG TPA: 4-vinyl reductase [Polyangiaceae bacterium]|jgi:hypothetical protein
MSAEKASRLPVEPPLANPPAVPAVPGMAKGVNFVNVRAFAETRFGDAGGWPALVSALGDEDRAAIEGTLAVGWYPLSLYTRLLHKLDATFGSGDLAIPYALGLFAAEHDLNTLHRAFMRLATPMFLLQKSADFWHRYYDSGRWVIERAGAKHAVGHLEEWGEPDAVLCREVRGYLTRTFELTGARQVTMQHTACRARGDARCTFVGRWS